VNFDNSHSAVGFGGAPVYYADATTLVAGTWFVAQLYAGPDANSLAPVGGTLTFRTGAGAGFFNTAGQDTTRTIPTVAPGANAVVQVRVWDAFFTSYEAAVSRGGGFGTSGHFTVATGGAGAAPANLVGLQSFSLLAMPPVPEPRTPLLIALGAALLLRRRKR
jgi:hypothetical protein